MRHWIQTLSLLGALLLASLPCAIVAQNDSLWSVWNNASAPDSSRLKAIQALAWKAVFEQPDSGMALAQRQLSLALSSKDLKAQYEAHTTLVVGSSMKSDYTTALEHAHQCLATAQAMGDRKREANAYSNMSNVYKNLGDLPQALEKLQTSLRIDTELDNLEGLAGTYNNIGNIHTDLGELEKALENYQRSARMAEELDNTRGRAQALLNMGNTHMQLGALDTALHEFAESLELYREMGRKLEMGMAFNNLGRVYTLLDLEHEAHASLDSAQTLLTKLGSMRPLTRTYVNRGNLLLQQGQARKAVEACSIANGIAEKNGLLQQRRECLQCLMLAYERLGDFSKAFAAQKIYIDVNDSLLKVNNGKEVTRLDVTRAFQERMLVDSLDNVRQRFDDQLAYEQQLGREREQRNIFLFSGIGVLIAAGALWNRLRYTRRSRTAIQKEKDRSDDLLHNILPVEVAAELKAKGSAEARHFDEVTILFTDFKGFTGIAEKLTPNELVTEIDACFKAFDAIMEKHGVEKIKTIGDAYMAAGGVPQPRDGSALDVVRAAIEIQAFMIRRKTERDALGAPAFAMRVGVHTGPVVAGIVGLKKFAYDIWGDAVNTASRMESSSEVGCVNVSGSTYELVRHASDLRFTQRGKIEAKGKGEMDMYFVHLERATPPTA